MRTELRMLEIWLASFVRAHAAWRKAVSDADAGDADECDDAARAARRVGIQKEASTAATAATERTAATAAPLALTTSQYVKVTP